MKQLDYHVKPATRVIRHGQPNKKKSMLKDFWDKNNLLERNWKNDQI